MFQCKCKTPPYSYLDYEIIELDKNNQGQARLQTCKICGSVWVNYLIEEPHYTKSGRWWRAEIQSSDFGYLKIENVKSYIESQESCFVGGSFYELGIHRQSKPIYIG